VERERASSAACGLAAGAPRGETSSLCKAADR
jgi:hypothetical protein